MISSRLNYLNKLLPSIQIGQICMRKIHFSQEWNQHECSEDQKHNSENEKFDLDEQIRKSKSFSELISTMQRNYSVLTKQNVKEASDYLIQFHQNTNIQKQQANKIQIDFIVDFLWGIRSQLTGRSLSKFLKIVSNLDISQDSKIDFVNDRRFFGLIADRAGSMRAQDAIDVFSSLIKLNKIIPWDLFVIQTLFEQITEKGFEKIGPDGIVVLSEIFQKTEFQDEEWNSSILRRAIKIIDQFQPNQLIPISNFCSSLVQGEDEQILFQKILNQSLLVFSGFEQIDDLIQLLEVISKWYQEISSEVQFSSKEDLQNLFECAATILNLHAENLTMHQYIIIMDSFQRVKQIDAMFFEEIAKSTINQIQNLNNNEISAFISCFSQENHLEYLNSLKNQVGSEENLDLWKNWLNSVFIQIQNKHQNFTNEDFSQCIYGLAKFSGYDEERRNFWDLIVQNINHRILHGVDEQILLKIIQTIQLLQSYNKSNNFFSNLENNNIENNTENQFKQQNLNQSTQQNNINIYETSFSNNYQKNQENNSENLNIQNSFMNENFVDQNSNSNIQIQQKWVPGISKLRYNQELYQSLGVGVLQQLADINAFTIVHALQVFFNGRYADVNLLEQLADDLIDQTETIETDDLILSVWYLSQLGISHENPIFDIAQRRTRKIISKYKNVENLQKLIWSMGYAKMWRRKLWWKEIVERFKFVEHDQLNLSLIFQVLQMAQGEKNSVLNIWKQIPVKSREQFLVSQRRQLDTEFSKKFQKNLQNLQLNGEISEFSKFAENNINLFCSEVFKILLKNGENRLLIVGDEKLFSSQDENQKLGQILVLHDQLKEIAKSVQLNVYNIGFVNQSRFDQFNGEEKQAKYILQCINDLN